MTSPEQPSENDIFAASAGFGSAETSLFRGIDAFTGPGLQPRYADEPTAPIELPAQLSCADFQRSIPVLLDGELVPAQRQIVEAHLNSCLACQSARTFQTHLRTVVAEKALDPMPDDVRARITRALGFD